MNNHWLVICISLIIILSYGFNHIAKKTSIPSVLLLIITGYIISLFYPLELNDIKPVLEIIGTIGLIMIVLEAALDLKLSKETLPLVIKSFLIALFLLAGTSTLIAMVIRFFYDTAIVNAFAYAIPLSIMSSAIIIPSVTTLSEHKKEFLIYEAAFSDILGIMAFYFLLDSIKMDGAGQITMNIALNVTLTIVIAVVIGYAVILFIQRITADVKLFLPIALLLLLYSAGKLMHLSSLIFILAFGLMINNKHIFFKGRLKKFIDNNNFNELLGELKLLTLESSFLVRTFFFIIFGMSISLSGINGTAIAITLFALAAIYGLRFITFSVAAKKEIEPAFFIAPRGLITVLLFFVIPAELAIQGFHSSILLLAIIVSSLVMMYGLIRHKRAMNRELAMDELQNSKMDEIGDDDKEELPISHE
ncbi:cation:proton antiporter [Fulvivirgaceae bacterium BMA10]|uniref:Cation:proton antiporter n=1 Tax=Splendidivirga corallicola TaxID=3051826 RepID=A0ABT8KWY8_9BACT|nr:cation:proton antiporter [Fulvivirgaceae bacterium BMA10]